MYISQVTMTFYAIQYSTNTCVRKLYVIYTCTKFKSFVWMNIKRIFSKQYSLENTALHTENTVLLVTCVTF